MALYACLGFLPLPQTQAVSFLFLPRVRKVRKKMESRETGKEIEGNPSLSPQPFCSFGEEVDKHFHRILESLKLENNLKILKFDHLLATQFCTSSDQKGRERKKFRAEEGRRRQLGAQGRLPRHLA